MTQKLIILRGLPASGKSTWAKEFVSKNPKYVRINNDELRSMINSGKFSKENEAMITAIRHSMIKNYLENGYNVIVDNTNLNPTTVEMDVVSAYGTGATVEFKDFLTDVDTCIARDKDRENKVGAKVIREMSDRWNWKPEPPRTFDRVVQDATLPKAFIFDIDGTLAYMNGRSPYDYSKVDTDGVYEDVRQMVIDMIGAGYRVFIVSGRKSECSKETMKWLDDNNIPYSDIFMREDDDDRNDGIVKYEILTKHILPNYYVQGVFDDRDRVVKMWREAGIRCYQVNYGNF